MKDSYSEKLDKKGNRKRTVLASSAYSYAANETVAPTQLVLRDSEGNVIAESWRKQEREKIGIVDTGGGVFATVLLERGKTYKLRF